MERYKPKKHKQPLKAIREMCIECMGTTVSPGYQIRISECPSTDCALYDFRCGNNPHHSKTLSGEQRNKKADIIKASII